MKSARSLLVLLSVGACAFASPTPFAPETEANGSSGLHISTEAVNTPLTREKKSTRGTCITVSEPYKAPFTICNDATASAVSALTHGGDGDAAKHLGGESSHVAGGIGTSAHGGGFHGLHGAPSPAHIASGGLFTSHQHPGGPHIAVHPALHTAIASHQGLPGAGYGLSGYGFPYGGQGFFPSGGGHYGYLPNRFDLVSPYGSLAYGVPAFDLYRATDNTDVETSTSVIPNVEKEEKERMSQSTEDERGIVADALEEELAAQALEQFRATQLEAARQAQLERALEESARSAVLAPSYAPLPLIDNYLPTLPARVGAGGYAAGVFPSSPAGGGCGALPLLFSCTPRLVPGRLVPGGGVHYPPPASWPGGAPLHTLGGGGSYRHSEQHAVLAPHSSKDTVDKITGGAMTNKMDMGPEKDSPAQREQVKTKTHSDKGVESPKTSGSQKT